MMHSVKSRLNGRYSTVISILATRKIHSQETQSASALKSTQCQLHCYRQSFQRDQVSYNVQNNSNFTCIPKSTLHDYSD